MFHSTSFDTRKPVIETGLQKKDSIISKWKRKENTRKFYFESYDLLPNDEKAILNKILTYAYLNKDKKVINESSLLITMPASELKIVTVTGKELKGTRVKEIVLSTGEKTKQKTILKKTIEVYLSRLKKRKVLNWRILQSGRYSIRQFIISKAIVSQHDFGPLFFNS